MNANYYLRDVGMGRGFLQISFTFFCTDAIYAGHLNIIKGALKYGRVVVGSLSDKESIYYNRLPTVNETLPSREHDHLNRVMLIENAE